MRADDHQASRLSRRQSQRRNGRSLHAGFWRHKDLRALGSFRANSCGIFLCHCQTGRPVAGAERFDISRADIRKRSDYHRLAVALAAAEHSRSPAPANTIRTPIQAVRRTPCAASARALANRQSVKVMAGAPNSDATWIAAGQATCE